MRLSTDAERDEELALATIAAAVGCGVAVFDTAHSYGRGADDMGHNERLLARALRASVPPARPRVVSKGGMSRAGGRWVPDGRARTLRSDCEASLAALDGVPIDLYLIHAPDPQTPWATTVRALARLVDEGLVGRVGLSNVRRGQLDQAVDLAPIVAVEVALSLYDQVALRGGVVERCAELGIAVIAHSPLGGPRNAGRLARHPVLAEVAAAHAATPAEAALAWVLGVSDGIVAIPGARRPQAARSAARAASLHLAADERAALSDAFAAPQSTRRPPARRQQAADVILVMGIPGAGKTRLAREFVERGYVRLNRDDRGGSLRDLTVAVGDELARGARRIVLDNTWLSRASRNQLIEAAARHQVACRCVWLDTSLAEAQVNVVERLLERFGALPSPGRLRQLGHGDPDTLMPTSQMRALRELEPPSVDEGFAAVERLPFARAAAAGRRGRGVLVAAAALGRTGWQRALEQADPGAPHLVFGWSPDAADDALAAAVAAVSARVSGPVDSAICPHPAGPPRCWCRPPLPGLPLEFARRRDIDLSRSTLVAAGPAHRTLARALGAEFVLV